MSHFESLCKNLEAKRQRGKLCDVTIKVEDELFQAHKIILASASKYFDVLFTSEIASKIEKEIEISGITASAFATCLQYIYSDNFGKEQQKFSDLLNAVNLLQLDHLKTLCEQQLKLNLDEKNCEEFYQLAQEHHCEALEQAAF